MQRIATLLLAVALSGCSSEKAAPDSLDLAKTGNGDASDVGTTPPATVALSELGKQGERVFMRCRSCHTSNAGGAHSVGPNLHGIMGSAAAQRPGFTYSTALSGAAATLRWSPDAMDTWLENPAKMIPGNKMLFAGLPDKADRDAVIAYLTETAGTDDR